MKKTSTTLYMLGIILAIYNVLVFVIFGLGEHDPTFWLSYGFTTAAVLIVGIVVPALGQKGRRLRDRLLGLPVLRHCVIYLVVQLVASVVCMIFHKTMIWFFPFVVQLLILLVFLLFLGLCLVSKTIVTETHEHVQRKTTFIGLLRADAELLCRKCDDAEAKKVFTAFAEAVRFSDPMSNDSLAHLEKELSKLVTEANRLLDAGDVANAVHCCQDAALLLEERNQKTKILKK